MGGEVCQGQNIPPLIMSDATKGGITLVTPVLGAVLWDGGRVNFHPLFQYSGFERGMGNAA